MAKKIHLIVVINMVITMVLGFNSCTKELNIEAPEQSTSWAAPKKTSLIEKNVWEEIVENFDFFFKYGSFESQVSRPIGAYGEATKVITVDSEEYLSGVKYVEGKLDTEKTDWESGYWRGTQVTRTQNFRLANVKYGADYSDTYYSTNAEFQKDTLKAEYADAQWNRSIKLDSTEVYNKTVDGQKGYYKIRDFIATVTNTASVDNAFVKDASKATKTFTMKDTLSLRFYVEPNPEDEFIRRFGEVELYKEGEKIVGIWTVKEEWTISGIREVYRKAVDFTAWAKGYDGDVVYPTNVAYQTTIEKWNGTGSKALVATALNGIEADKFNSNFEVYGDESVTLTYEDMSVTFNAILVHETVKQTIGEATLTNINGANYNVSPYKAEILPVYTVTCGEKSVSLELKAEANRQLRVRVEDHIEKKVESQKYEALFETSGANLTTKVNANSWDNVTYTNGVETGRETVTHNLKVEANISGGQPFAVDSKENLNKEYKITSISRTGNQVTTVTEDGVKKERTIQNFNATVNNGQTLNIRVTTEKDLTEGMTLSHTYCESVKAVGVETNVSGNTVTLTPKVNVMLVEDNGVATKAATGAAKAYTIESSMVGTYTPETTQEYEPEVVNGRPVVHEYDVTDGVRTFKQDYPYTPNKNLTAKSAKDMYGENYSTVYNGTRNVTTNTSTNGYWTVENTKGQVTSTLSNGISSDDNIADYGYDSAMTFKKGNYSYTFVGTVALSNSTDALKDAGTKTISGITYNVSDYKENFNMVYTIDGIEIAQLSDAVKRQILEEIEIEDLVPGTIWAVNVRAVAATWNGYKYVNTDGHLDKIKGLAIVTKEHKGTYIPFAAASADVALPTDEEIKNANYIERSYYNSDYVAGYDTSNNGNWQLATVEDRSNQIVYFDNGTAVRSLTQKSMNTWNWTSAEQTSQVGGYNIEVKDGVCTVYFNGKLIKIFK